MPNDFISAYLDYTAETEPPYIYHRWCAITAIGALLGRSCFLPFGHARVFPNLYTMLIGDPGCRKSTAIKTICRKLVSSSGYDLFAADKGSKEKFLIDLEGLTEETNGSYVDGRVAGRRKVDETTLENLWGPEANCLEPKEVFICADEFSEFSGVGNAEFYTTLGNFWDWDDEHRPFANRLKNSKSIAIFQPTVSILGGTTSSKFAKIFPPEIMDDGFLSRMVVVGGSRSERRYPEPPEPDPEQTALLIEQLKQLRIGQFPGGAIHRTDEARALLATIYTDWQEISDVRFRSYSTRRYTQLLKLCIIVAASLGTSSITEEVVIRANTYLSAAEVGMPAALGEFGKSKNSDIANKIMDVLGTAVRPLKATDLWKHVDKDLEKLSMLGDIMNGLQIAGKVQMVKGLGWLPKKVAGKAQQFTDWSLLTEEERGVL